MQYNDSTMTEGAVPGGESKPLFGSPLSEVTDVDRLREIATTLWELLDDIDTDSDMFKPSYKNGYRVFYEYAMKKSQSRHTTVTSDGYDLYLPNVTNDDSEGSKAK